MLVLLLASCTGFMQRVQPVQPVQLILVAVHASTYVHILRHADRMHVHSSYCLHA